MDDFYNFLFEAPQPQPAAIPQPHAVPAQAQKTRGKKRGSRLGLKIVVLALVCSLLGGAVGAGAVWFAKDTTAETAQQPQATATALVSSREDAELDLVAVDGTQQLSASEVYEANVNATVGITTEIVTHSYFGYSTGAAAGSGFVLSDNGYILTNYHVVEGASSIRVAMYDGTSYDAVLIGYDAGNDVAVLKIDAAGLQTVVLGNSDQLRVGDTVLAIGNPLGELTFSLTTGIVSALDREVTLSGNMTMNLIQTDCAINSGNSGGALFNSYGEVVGITNAKYSSSGYGEASIDNIGFAIPINSVLEIVNGIIDMGYEMRPYIGVTVADSDDPAGALILSVIQSSPADLAGLHAGDVVTYANGKAVGNSSALAEQISACETGSRLCLTVSRDGRSFELTVTVGERPRTAQS